MQDSNIFGGTTFFGNRDKKKPENDLQGVFETFLPAIQDVFLCRKHCLNTFRFQVLLLCCGNRVSQFPA